MIYSALGFYTIQASIEFEFFFLFGPEFRRFVFLAYKPNTLTNRYRMRQVR
jgi:hypothetical protein